jgi:hypothetical protein
MTTTRIALDCSACKSEKTMKAAEIARFHGIVRVIGYVIVVPSVIGIIFSIIMFMAAGSASSEVMSTTQSSAAQAGAAMGTAIGVGFAFFMGCMSLVSGLVGWILLLKKKVFKCNVCGFILDRA